MATTALEVKPENFDTEIVQIKDGLFAHVELGSDVEEVTAGVTAYRHGEHHSDIVLLVFCSGDLLKFFVVEIGRVVLN